MDLQSTVLWAVLFASFLLLTFNLPEGVFILAFHDLILHDHIYTAINCTT